MQTVKSVRPPESPEDPNPVNRLVTALTREGFVTMQEERESQTYGETIYRRPERVLFADGETVFVLIDYPQVNEKILERAVEGITHLFVARSRKDKALAVLQATTVFVCIIARTESPHYESLNRF